MKHLNAVKIEAIEKENERLKRENEELKRHLYMRKFINNPLTPDERED